MNPLKQLCEITLILQFQCSKANPLTKQHEVALFFAALERQ